MAPIVLKIKGNESFSPFSNLHSGDDLSKTWRVCTKVKDSLENGSRLENLSWRLWFLHNVLVGDPKAKSNFKRISSNATHKLESEKGSSLNQLREKSRPNKKKQEKAIEHLDSNVSPTTTTAKKTKKTYTQPESQPKPPHLDTTADIPSLGNPNQYGGILDYTCSSQNAPPVSNTNDTNAYPQTSYADPSSYLSEPSIMDRPVTENFVLHQYTSDQARDQVVELENIFGSFGDMQAFMNPIPGEMPMVEMDLDTMMDEPSWQQYSQPNYTPQVPLYSLNSYSYPNSLYDPTQNQLSHQIPSENYTASYQPITTTSVEAEPTTSPPASPPLPPPPAPPSISQTVLPTSSPTTLPISHGDGSSAYYVTYSDSMPPLPTGTLRNKLLASLPRKTLASAERLLSPAAQSAKNIKSGKRGIPSEVAAASSGPAPASLVKNPSQRFTNGPDQATGQFNAAPQTAEYLPTKFESHTEPNRQKTPPKTMRPMAVNSTPSEGKPPICSNCDTTSTPLWRRSVQDELLCNACGLYLKLHNAPRPKHLKPHSIRKDSRGEEDLIQPVCSNCKTNTTPLWRRDIEGQSLCNACGLYLKLHHEKRPLSMKTDIIKKRQRCENQNQQTGKKPSKKGRSESQEQDEEITLEITTSVWQNNTIQQYSNPYIYSSNNKDKASYRQKNNGRDELVISR